jgi:hypothetical protein
MGIGRKPFKRLLRRGKKRFWREMPQEPNILYAPRDIIILVIFPKEGT